MTTPSASRAPSRAGALLRVLVVLMLGMTVGRWACAPTPEPPADAGPAPAATTWTCSMHPQVKLPDPGQCPICFMDLIPLDDDADAGLHPRQLTISENAAALASIRTAPVERRAATRDVRLVGRVTFDDALLAYITAWVPSRIDRLFVDSEGVRVQAGEHIVEVYSPLLISTQQELISAVRSVTNLAANTNDVIRARYEEAVVSARERLKSWGLLEDQIDEIIARDEPLQHVTIRAPVGGIVVDKNAVRGDYVQTGTRIYTIADLTSVWVELDAYESDLAWLSYGQQVEVAVDAYPGETFAGRISLIEPVLDQRTRTVKVRVSVANADLRLKPEMFVRARVRASIGGQGELVAADVTAPWACPMHPDVVAEEPGARCAVCGMELVSTAELGLADTRSGELPLVIPAGAPLVTGRRAVVYVRLPGDGPPVFEGREIVLGPRAGDDWVVRDGLAEGEQVVVQGAFKLDAELQLRARPSMMSPEVAEHAEPEHDTAMLATPVAFRAKLGRLVPPLTVIAEALAADDPAGALAALPPWREAVSAVPMQALDAAAHDVWMPLAADLARATDELDAYDIESQRAALHTASRALIEALDRFGWEGEHETPAVFHCPMAFEGDGGHWIGYGDTVSNPYYGASMLRCGERQRGLAREP